MFQEWMKNVPLDIDVRENQKRRGETNYVSRLDG